jgi:hypothetical protein
MWHDSIHIERRHSVRKALLFQACGAILWGQENRQMARGMLMRVD